MTVLALPVWLTMPQLTAIEHPWRAASFLTLAATGLLALTAQRAPVRLLVAGLLLATIVPGFLGLMVQFGSPGWPRFLPAAERMAFTEQYSGSDSAEHLPAAAAAAGWDVVTAGGPPPYPRPVPPPGTQHLPGGFLVPEAAAPFTLPQFWFPSWQARDALGPVPLRASPEGFVEVLVSRPVHNLEVRIGTTVWERAGWVLTLIASLALLAMQALNGFQAARKRERMSDAGLA
jgi:hypothetical protein